MKDLKNVSNINIVRKKAIEYGYKNPILISTRKDKKYMIYDDSGYAHHFGNPNYEDFTKHKDEKRRLNYLKRSSKIGGDWRKNKYAPNRLSRDLLW